MLSGLLAGVKFPPTLFLQSEFASPCSNKSPRPAAISRLELAMQQQVASPCSESRARASELVRQLLIGPQKPSLSPAATYPLLEPYGYRRSRQPRGATKCMSCTLPSRDTNQASSQVGRRLPAARAQFADCRCVWI